MSKIDLNPLPSGHATVTALNNRLQKIEDEFNNKVLYRSNPDSEPNAMDNELDMAEHRIINLPDAIDDSEPIPLGQVLTLIDEEVTEAINEIALSMGTGNVVGPASSLDSQVALFNGITGRLLKPDQGVVIKKINTWADISTTPVSFVGQVFILAQHTSGGLGGGTLMSFAGSVTDDGGTRKNSATPGFYLQRVGLEKGVDIFMFGAQRNSDIRAALQAAVDAAPSTYDITSAYVYEPSWIINIPYGNYKLSSRVLIAKNNIIIRGQGMFNTYIKAASNAIGDPVQTEMIRYRGAYACGLYDLTLDGGLPFNLTAAVSYGCRIPLVLDQVAHFAMDGVNVCNYRTRGIQGIHVWESKLGEVRCFNGWGFDDGLGIIPGGLIFDGFSKEENLFPGSESNQVYIEKYAFAGAGSPVRWDSPCFNVVIEQIVWEGRTYNSYQPNNMNASKIYISGLSANCGIKHGWVYFHDQPFASNSTFIDANNAGMGCYFEDISIYQENAAPGTNFMEITDIFYSSSAFPVRVNVSIQDQNNNTNLFKVGSSGSLWSGDIFYRNNNSRTLTNVMGSFGSTNYNGKITLSTGAFSAAIPTVYDFSGTGQKVSAIDGSGVYEEYRCRAWVRFNGSTGAIIGTARNVASVTRNSAGNYTVTFLQAMPDVNYVANANSNASATGAERAYVSGYSTTNCNVINAAGTTFADATIVTVTVFR